MEEASPSDTPPEKEILKESKADDDDKEEDNGSEGGAVGVGSHGDKNRSERKRKREKQRRSDLSSAFDAFSGFLSAIEPDLMDGNHDRKRKNRGKGGDFDLAGGGITRLDLISNGLAVMKRLHRENRELKLAMEQIRSVGGPQALSASATHHHHAAAAAAAAAASSVPSAHHHLHPSASHRSPHDQVLVMVPSLAPAMVGEQRIARAAYPAYYTTAEALLSQPSLSAAHPTTSAATYAALEESRMARASYYPMSAIDRGFAPIMQGTSPSAAATAMGASREAWARQQHQAAASAAAHSASAAAAAGASTPLPPWSVSPAMQRSTIPKDHEASSSYRSPPSAARPGGDGRPPPPPGPWYDEHPQR